MNKSSKVLSSEVFTSVQYDKRRIVLLWRKKIHHSGREERERQRWMRESHDNSGEHRGDASGQEESGKGQTVRKKKARVVVLNE